MHLREHSPLPAELIASYYGENLSYQAALDLTHYPVRDGLMNQGATTAIPIPTGKAKGEDLSFLLVEIDDYEIQSKVVRLRLSTAGLEMLFKTKEMYNELQVSITQLYLRQRIQKSLRRRPALSGRTGLAVLQ